ncbi:hypothetical protein [Altererythrobacter fulvus]|uniref:SMP-30/gluconolactonase/LRE family protein n=1 Tax=Caenibius fulvus TaxID=2126012 RepID=UPI003019E6AD
MIRRSAMLAALLLAGTIALPAALQAAEGAPADIPINGSRIFPESISADIDGNIYVGSANGTIYRVESEGTTAEPWILPSAENGLTSLFGVLADENRGLLWVCNNPPFGGPPQPGAKSGLKSFDLFSGELRGTYDFPGDGPAACNDMTIQNLADIYVTDTAGGRIFHLAPDAEELELFAQSPELVGVDGIAVSGDGTLYINNVRQNLVQRIKQNPDATYAGLTTLTLSEPVSGPDALRLVGDNRFLQAEGSGNRVTYVEVNGNSAKITPIRTGLDSSPGVTHVNGIAYATEGKIAYMFDPALKDKSPDPFIIRAFKLPDWP